MREFIHLPTAYAEDPLREKEAALDREWALLTEAVKREAFQNTDVRNALLEIVHQPLDELMPAKFLESVREHSQLISRVAKSGKELESFLAEDSHPNLMQSANLHWNAKFEQQNVIEVSRRLRFARDLKLLAAGVTLSLSEQEQVKFGLDVELTDQAQDYPEILDSTKWQGRREIHDRVYAVHAGEKPFILKERKTSQHKQQNRHTSEPTNTSQEEVRIGQELSEQASYEGNDIKLSYELPLAAVTFPDGYQFALFKFEEGLVEHQEAVTLMTEFILANFSEYQAEYDEANRIVKELLGEPGHSRLLRKLALGQEKSAFVALKKRFGMEPLNVNVELSKEDFSGTLAEAMVFEGRRHLSEAITRLGYRQDDGAQHEYRVHKVPQGRFILEVIGFDFEFHRKVNESLGSYNEDAFQTTAEYENRAQDPDTGYMKKSGNQNTWQEDRHYEPKDLINLLGYHAVKDVRRRTVNHGQQLLSSNPG